MCEMYGHEAKPHRHTHSHTNTNKKKTENKLCYRRMYTAFTVHIKNHLQKDTHTQTHTCLFTYKSLRVKTQIV